MITRRQFDTYKEFREQAGCPFCMRKEILSGDGLFYCNLDKKFNPLKEKIIKKFKSKWWFLHIFDKETTSYFAWHCERCHRYWIEDITGKMTKEIPWEKENIPKGDSEWFTATPRKAVMRLAEKANEFFEQEYNASDEIHSIIKTYTELLLKRHMDIINGRHIIDETIKPLCLYSDKLTDWVFNTIQSSLKKKFPYKSDCVHQALTVYDNDAEVISAVCAELSHMLMDGFVMDLWQAMKEHYQRVLQNDYPYEYNLLNSISQEKWRNDIWEELYGRSIKVIFECLINFGIDIRPLISDKDKIILGNLVINGQVGVNIDKSAIMRDVVNYSSVYTENIREKMMINAGVNIQNSSVGRDVINQPTVIVGSDSNEIEVLQSISGLISDLQKSNLEVAKNLISLLQELTQAIKTNDTGKQAETKQKISGFWLAVGSILQKVLQSSAHLTTVLKYLGVEINLCG